MNRVNEKPNANFRSGMPYDGSLWDGIWTRSQEDERGLISSEASGQRFCHCHAHPALSSASSKFPWALSNLIALERMNLFTHRNLCKWIDQPFETPPVLYEPEHLALNWV